MTAARRVFVPALAAGCLALAAASLPPPVRAAGEGGGSEQVRRGRAVFAAACSACHGETGRGGVGYANPIWGDGARIAKYKHAGALFEYNQLLMPFDDPTRVGDEAKWAVTAYILAEHGALPRDGTLGPDNAASVVIP